MDRFLIAPFESGLRTDLKPWRIPEDAFEMLNNAYIFRGRVKKRFGSSYTGTSTVASQAQFSSRLRINIGTTDINGSTAAPITVPGSVGKVGQLFSVGDAVFTVTTAGLADLLRSDGVLAASTFNTATGILNIVTCPYANTTIFWYPDNPVMGISMLEEGVVDEQSAIAFDTQFSYIFSGSSWSRLGSVPPSQWHGTDLNYFWSCNWRGARNDIFALFATNFNASLTFPIATTDDPIKYKLKASAEWTDFTPRFKIGLAAEDNRVMSALIIIQFKNRLLLLNTIESTTPATAAHVAHVNRCRFSQNGSPLDAAAFLEPKQVGYLGGGYIDAPTKEAIVSAEYIKDRVIVYFERSTWELAYTGNEVLPFVWQKLNTELGSQSTFSTVPFDKAILTIGNTGVNSCNGSNVERIDSNIPDEIFSFKNRDGGIKRVAGIRDYSAEMVYWAFPTTTQPDDDKYPSRVLVYNYSNGSWAFNDDCITCFGYLEQQADLTWENAHMTWNDADFTWTSGVVPAESRQVIAGNHHGFVFTIDRDINRNAGVFPIVDIFRVAGETRLTILNHNIPDGDFIKIENCSWFNGLGEPTIDNEIFEVMVVDKDTISIGNIPFADVYTGIGTAALVSRISILSKQWNPYIDKGMNFSIDKILFCVDKTEYGEITVDYYPSSANVSILDDANDNGCLLGTGVLETRPYPSMPMETYQDRLWHPVYFSVDGNGIQIFLTHTNEQMENADIVESGFELEGLILFTRPTMPDLL